MGVNYVFRARALPQRAIQISESVADSATFV